MPEHSTPTEPAQTMGRPFPWFCSRCRRKEVWRTKIPYQCQRFYRDQPITVVIPELAVPKCANCGELEFDYVAEEQINQAYRDLIALIGSADTIARSGRTGFVTMQWHGVTEP